ncbi:XdhC family protein [Sorangium sp. So ce233]|uniref:XdhC family protein n=1 Tax=Sorangium sp. So ce233 TaxID=3133290 RepID=UPI003F5DC052
MTPADPRFYAALLEMLGSERSFAVATVVEVRGSASGKPGAKAIFDEHGHNLHGWGGRLRRALHGRAGDRGDCRWVSR